MPKLTKIESDAIVQTFVEGSGDWSVETDGCVVSVAKHFQAGNEDAARETISAAHRLINAIPISSPGTVWGGDGVGFYSAVQHGHVKVHKSGCNRNIVKQIAKTLAS